MDFVNDQLGKRNVGFYMVSFFKNLNVLQKDESAKLGLMEFHMLWSKIQKYLVCFCSYGLKWLLVIQNLYLLTQHMDVWVT